MESVLTNFSPKEKLGRTRINIAGRVKVASEGSPFLQKRSPHFPLWSKMPSRLRGVPDSAGLFPWWPRSPALALCLETPLFSDSMSPADGRPCQSWLPSSPPQLPGQLLVEDQDQGQRSSRTLAILQLTRPPYSPFQRWGRRRREPCF